LQTTLALNDAWDDWMVREMALHKELFFMEGLAAMDSGIVLRDDFIEQPHRGAMGDPFFNFFDSHGIIKRKRLLPVKRATNVRA
jgi:hypothetical protein